MKTYPGIIARQHFTVQKQVGLLIERYAGLRKGPLQYCCNLVWMKNGCCYLRNMQGLLSDGKTLHEKRFEEPFRGPRIPFGVQRSNIRRIWKGDTLGADIENMDASGIHARRLNAKEVLTPLKW